MVALQGAPLAALIVSLILQGGSTLSVQLPLFDQSPLSDSKSQPHSSSSDKPLVDSESFQATISGDKLLERAQTLFKIAERSHHEYNRPTRVIGSQGHLGTLEYVLESIKKLGSYYNIVQQPFPAYSGSVFESRLVLGDEVAHSASAMSLTPPTKNKEPVHGELVLVSNNGCSADDYPANVEGNIAFIRRGTCAFGDKSALAGRAGAVAAVIYNSETGTLHGTMGTPLADHVATFGLDLVEAKPVLEKLEKGKAVDAIAYIDGIVQTISTSNIVIQTAGGDPENCVMLGAHSDSVAEGPGINDDGSGTLSLIEVATQLTKFRVNNCVRFAWWSAEEEGLLGSDFYASTLPAAENPKIRLFMDYDMLASPNFAYQVYNATNTDNPLGSEELKNLYIDWYEAHDLNYTLIPFDGRSDYDGFIRAGIPAGGIATGAEGIKTPEEAEQFGGKAGDWYDPCYHQLCDHLGNVNATAWELNTKLVAHSVATYAVSFKGFPEREPATVQGLSQYAQSVKYRGDFLFW
ncbi:aminopeptidase Y precursor [Coniella lustricola]|uniref:Peptide hydrolase n=1 Tax=Coniella lustricola TaxID=2025994 RepID=A0A2T3ADH4_9PEZI|nr:aminopeptidase Y precursor [Coniella lustricola]